jgi:hypothetical protein
MKKRYITMSILVQGPKQPGTDINLYLTLLKEELATLWEDGAVRGTPQHKTISI